MPENFPIPAAVRCDFCPTTFAPTRWNQRTCTACAEAGWPDQSVGPWRAYAEKLKAKLRDLGRRSKKRGNVATLSRKRSVHISVA